MPETASSRLTLAPVHDERIVGRPPAAGASLGKVCSGIDEPLEGLWNGEGAGPVEGGQTAGQRLVEGGRVDALGQLVTGKLLYQGKAWASLACAWLHASADQEEYGIVGLEGRCMQKGVVEGRAPLAVVVGYGLLAVRSGEDVLQDFVVALCDGIHVLGRVQRGLGGMRRGQGRCQRQDQDK